MVLGEKGLGLVQSFGSPEFESLLLLVQLLEEGRRSTFSLWYVTKIQSSRGSGKEV